MIPAGGAVCRSSFYNLFLFEQAGTGSYQTRTSENTKTQQEAGNTITPESFNQVGCEFMILLLLLLVSDVPTLVLCLSVPGEGVLSAGQSDYDRYETEATRSSGRVVRPTPCEENS